jgi:hypothetical protein
MKHLIEVRILLDGPPKFVGRMDELEEPIQNAIRTIVAGHATPEYAEVIARRPHKDEAIRLSVRKVHLKPDPEAVRGYLAPCGYAVSTRARTEDLSQVTCSTCKRVLVACVVLGPLAAAIWDLGQNLKRRRLPLDDDYEDAMRR